MGKLRRMRINWAAPGKAFRDRSGLMDGMIALHGPLHYATATNRPSAPLPSTSGGCTYHAIVITFRIVPDIRKGSGDMFAWKGEPQLLA